MDTSRRRLTRDEQRAETRDRLLDAAEAVFASRGIGQSSIEEISEAAGYSRGAFYSNFADKDALVSALIDRHQQTSTSEAQAMQAAATSPAEFLAALREREISRSSAEAAVFMEYVLHAIRSPDGRARLQETHRSSLADTGAMLTEQFAAMGSDSPIDPVYGAKIMLALDEGFALLRLVDPDEFPAGIWGSTIEFLNEAVLALMEKRSTPPA